MNHKRKRSPAQRSSKKDRNLGLLTRKQRLRANERRKVQEEKGEEVFDPSRVEGYWH